MAKKVLTIEIGARYTRICEMTGHQKNPVLHNCITFSTPKGTIEDGYIRDKATLAAIINQKIAEMKSKVNDVIFVLNSTKIANREILIPNIKEDKVRALIEMHANEYFPIDISEYTVAYYYMDKMTKKKNPDQKNKVLLLAAPNNLIQSYISLAQACQLQIVALDYMGNSYFQIAKSQVEQGTNITIHINENTSIINIMENETLLLQRIVPYGANEVIEKVKANDSFKCTTDEEAIDLLCREKLINYQFELPKEEIGVKYSLASESYDQAMQEIRSKEEVTESFRFIMNNVIRVLDYYTAKHSDKKISFVYISGLGAQFTGAVHLFKNELGYDCRKMDELYSTKVSDKISITKEQLIEYIACIGAGIKPVDFHIKKQVMGDGTMAGKGDIKNWVYAFAFVATVSVAFTGIEFANKIYQNSKQRSLNKQIEQLSSIDTVFNERDTAKSNYENMQNVYDLTANDNSNLDELIEELEEKLPSNMSVESLSTTTTDVTMHIVTSNKISVAKMIMTMSEIKSLKNVTVASISETVEGKQSGAVSVEFDVSAQFSDEAEEEATDETASEQTDTEDTDNTDTASEDAE